MRSTDIEVGEVYAVKVSGKVRPVRITTKVCNRQGRRDGWMGINLRTGREVHIRSPQRCRYQMSKCRTCRQWCGLGL